MNLLSTTDKPKVEYLGVECGSYMIPPRCDKCGGYAIVQDMGAGDMYFHCTQCGAMGVLYCKEVTLDDLELFKQARRSQNR